MRSLQLPHPADRPLRVLAVGAHCDDIEIGAGGTLARLADETGGHGVEFTAVIITSTPKRAAEATGCLTELVAPAPMTVITHGLPDSRLPSHYDQVKDILGDLSRHPWDVVFTHHDEDAHQDHRLLGTYVPTALRNHLVFSFEIPKWDGDLGRIDANVYVQLTPAQMHAKWATLDAHYVSQRPHDWWSEETFSALGRLRGMECRAPYAEAFAVRKAVLDLSPSGTPDTGSALGATAVRRTTTPAPEGSDHR